MLPAPVTSILGRDPERKHRINANSFQQQAITTINGFQYAAFYTPVPASKVKTPGACFVNLAQRHVGSESVGKWETIVFEDYEQTVDDGHNTISIGVCAGDGTVHVAFDHHCDRLRFRISEVGVAGPQEDGEGQGQGWDVKKFGETQDFLPGIKHNTLMDEVTYPRFVNVGDKLLLTWRIGQAGLGSDILFHYSSLTHQYTYLGQHLTGVSNSPYINGMDFRHGRLHISWCYRKFTLTQASTESGAHKQQAGPNGPENNYDFNYAYSTDLGLTWLSSAGTLLANLQSPDSSQRTILPTDKWITAFQIPMGSGILNQESQAAGWEGDFWALNREKVQEEEKWVVYALEDSGWKCKVVETETKPTETGNRGSICVSRRNDVFLVLPGNTDSSLTIMRARRQGLWEHGEWEIVWRGEGFDGEPCVDVGRLEIEEVLSVFTRAEGVDGERNVVVLDFDLDMEDAVVS